MNAQELFAKLKPNPDNPRRIGKQELEKLKNKIKSFPEMLEKRPVVYDSSQDYLILGGNQRVKVIGELIKDGLEIKDEYFADCADWSDEKKKQFVIMDNVSDGEWDYEILRNGWAELPLEEWGINVVDMDLEKVDDVEVDQERLNVLVVEAPEAPRLKERRAFYCKNIDQFNKIVSFFKKGISDLDVDKLEKVIDEIL